MTPYTANLNCLEFMITYACTGRGKHCSEGSHHNLETYVPQRIIPGE